MKGDIPLVVESHSIYRMTLGQKGLRNRYTDYKYRKGLSKVQMIVALTEGDAEDWRKDFSNVCVIPDMVHLNEGGLSSLKNKRVIWVGRFDYQKRPMEAVHIWQRVYPKYPDWHLDFYGEGEQQQVLAIAAQSLGMNIHIHQPTECIFDAYRESSILISTSLFEPFGLVIPEAMSCGLPVVAYDVPFGPSSILSDSLCDYLIYFNDQCSFAERLSSLMSDMSSRFEMSRSAVEQSKQFSVEKILPQWNSLFYSLKRSN